MSCLVWSWGQFIESLVSLGSPVILRSLVSLGSPVSLGSLMFDGFHCC